MFKPFKTITLIARALLGLALLAGNLQAFSIRGKVTEEGSSTALPGIYVELYEYNASYEDWDYYDEAVTKSDGTYLLGSLPSGTYRVLFGDYDTGTYLAEAYDNAPDVYDDSATNIVIDRANAVDINAALAFGGNIIGRVTGVSSEDIDDVYLYAYWQDPESLQWKYHTTAFCESNGDYSIGGLPGGKFRLLASHDYGKYYDKWYLDSADIENATDILVTAPDTTTVDNLSLSKAARITGEVRDASTDALLPDIWVEAFKWNPTDLIWEPVESTISDFGGIGVTGTYAVGPLEPGTYRVLFFDDDNSSYTPPYGGASYLSSTESAPDLDSGTDVVVTSQTDTTNIKGFISPGGLITGTVTDADDGTPLPGTDIVVYRYNSSSMTWNYFTNLRSSLSSATYDFAGSVGTYRLDFTDPLGDYAPISVPDIAVTEGGTTVADVSMSLGTADPPVIVGIEPSSPMEFTISFTGTTDQQYQLQWDDDLTAPWTDEGSPITCQPGINTVLVTKSGNRGFWRLMEVTP